MVEFQFLIASFPFLAFTAGFLALKLGQALYGC